ncbi:hypothetical protein DH2020_039626 [Rehmannia glutinosa]|uniref:Uncharacterized protein n=1 Tax=Rehmannia glutinosa TaxID=99300 RepID=A0ABR0UVI4_REHGL
MGINGEMFWDDTCYIPPLPPNFGRGVGRPARARRLESDEVVAPATSRPTLYPPSTQSSYNLEKECAVHISTQQSQTTQKKGTQLAGPSPWQQLQIGREGNFIACALDAEGNEAGKNSEPYPVSPQL